MLCSNSPEFPCGYICGELNNLADWRINSTTIIPGNLWVEFHSSHTGSQRAPLLSEEVQRKN